MAEAAKAAGRKPEEVLLCAACKGRTNEEVLESAELPVDLFGENRAQELAAHQDAGAYLHKPCHFIGVLQTNKVRRVVGRAEVIQSVGSLRLLQAISREAHARGLCQDILFEINLGNERNKDGAPDGQLPMLLENAAGFQHIRVRGLMAIPPVCDNAGETRSYFARLYKLLEQAKTDHYDKAPLDILSMGMTDSFEAAILEGATMVRVGTGIYGAR
jgi:pyridoxal phosphate enzyme (YggS family)